MLKYSSFTIFFYAFTMALWSLIFWSLWFPSDMAVKHLAQLLHQEIDTKATWLCLLSVLRFSLQAQLSACKSQLIQEDGRERRPMYRHNQQLEELRNLQDRLTQEKEAWQREKDAEERYIEEKKAELQRLQVSSLQGLQHVPCVLQMCEFHSKVVTCCRNRYEQNKATSLNSGNSCIASWKCWQARVFSSAPIYPWWLGHCPMRKACPVKESTSVRAQMIQVQVQEVNRQSHPPPPLLILGVSQNPNGKVVLANPHCRWISLVPPTSRKWPQTCKSSSNSL